MLSNWTFNRPTTPYHYTLATITYQLIFPYTQIYLYALPSRILSNWTFNCPTTPYHYTLPTITYQLIYPYTHLYLYTPPS